MTREVERLATLTSTDVVAALDPGGRVFASGGAAAALLAAGRSADSRSSGSWRTAAWRSCQSGAFRYAATPLLVRRPRGRDAGGGHEPRQRLRAGPGAPGGRGHRHHRERRRGGRHGRRRVDARRGGVDRRAAQHDGARTARSTPSGRCSRPAPCASTCCRRSTRPPAAATRSALLALGTIALWAFVLAAFASLWLARTLTDPINRVSHAIATMTAARDFSRTLEPTGKSRELDVSWPPASTS